VRFQKLFPAPKPILGMLHLTGATPAERLEIARWETEALVANGVDGLVVENYFGDVEDVRAVLGWLAERSPPVRIGLNVLRDFRLAFDLAERFRVDFVQIDSVAGHLAPAEDAVYARELTDLRSRSRVAVLGGVRFKYQPVLSGRDEAEDLRIGAMRCDAIVATGEATGQPTDLDRLHRFRAVLGRNAPLLVGAGLTAANAAEQLAVADGAIVGSFFKDAHADTGLVRPDHVAALMAVVRDVRNRRTGGPDLPADEAAAGRTSLDGCS
jgi:uncharacterized protein